MNPHCLRYPRVGAHAVSEEEEMKEKRGSLYTEEKKRKKEGVVSTEISFSLHTSHSLLHLQRKQKALAQDRQREV